jgi:adenylate cyclase
MTPRDPKTIWLPLQRLHGFLTWISEFGTVGYRPDIKRRLMILNMIAYLIAITTLIYGVQQMALDYEKFKPLVWLNFALVLVAFAVPLAHRINDIAGGLIIVAVEYVAQVVFAKHLGNSAGLQIHFFVMPAATFIVLGLQRLWLAVPMIALGAALHLWIWFSYPPEAALIDAGQDMLDAIYVQAAVTTTALIGASVFYAFRLAEAAKAETDALLRNILPDEIVERLQSKPDDIVADTFSDASILFADVSGFVPLAKSMGPQKTVVLLNNLVTAFDALAGRHGIEKIKTIGDAYMAASGLPVPSARHTARLALMALDMLEAVEALRRQTGLDLHMRLGIATGPVMAGVIGKQKFSYDVWGDTVNLAARLEGASERDRILVCEDTYSVLRSEFLFEDRGLVGIKGVGECRTWFLTGATIAKGSPEIIGSP